MLLEDKAVRRRRRREARAHKILCPCGRVGCETGRGGRRPDLREEKRARRWKREGE